MFYGWRIVGVAFPGPPCLEPGSEQIAWPGPAASPGHLLTGP
jgi:hypothetical protein